MTYISYHLTTYFMFSKIYKWLLNKLGTSESPSDTPILNAYVTLLTFKHCRTYMDESADPKKRI